ncbi:DUF3347 domain-containing protein [Flavobacterium sp.]|uniref:DUF3347 domain-containing protein n=1 Tax=Flavobacterium sp. TaxID=239 RepID=UPI002B4AC52D|nr:DUF3347 domain-containing protein [Flavobacterium sp.]HLP63122.1 DUF3347 domain-containing protein [Flavobacterium sp.]
MKSISKILVAITLLLSFTGCEAQISNAKTETVKIYGNCGMCEKTIEKAGNQKKIATVDWDKDTKMATITYDAKQTTKDAILKRIALSGYDSDTFLAPDDTYSKLPNCCQYDREAKVAVKIESKKEVVTEEHTNYTNPTQPITETKQTNQLKVVFDSYFEVKDALVKTDGKTASAKAKELTSVINAIKMGDLTTDEHNVWMKVLKEINADVQQITDTKDTKKQREYFIRLSKNMYALIKVSKQETPVYYQHCPMANDGKGANWLSKENVIKNPYYGSMMLNCGNTVETIK